MCDFLPVKVVQNIFRCHRKRFLTKVIPIGIESAVLSLFTINTVQSLNQCQDVKKLAMIGTPTGIQTSFNYFISPMVTWRWQTNSSAHRSPPRIIVPISNDIITSFGTASARHSYQTSSSPHSSTPSTSRPIFTLARCALSNASYNGLFEYFRK